MNLKVSYQNKFLDLLIFSFFNTFQSLVCQACILFLTLTSSGQYMLTFSVRGWVTGVICYLSFAIFIFALQALGFLFRVKDRSLYVERFLEVTDEGLISVDMLVKAMVYWRGLYKIAKRGSLICLYVNQVSALVIPARAFNSREEQSAFFSLLKGKIEEGRKDLASYGLR